MRWIVLAALLLAACRHTPAYIANLDDWRGKDEATLIRGWGIPTQRYTVGASSFLRFREDIPVTANKPFERFCDTTFELQKGLVVSSKWEGNHCRPKPIPTPGVPTKETDWEKNGV